MPGAVNVRKYLRKATGHLVVPQFEKKRIIKWHAQPQKTKQTNTQTKKLNSILQNHLAGKTHSAAG